MLVLNRLSKFQSNLLLLFLCILSRLITSIFYIEDIDSLRFALAIQDYSIINLQPHFPDRIPHATLATCEIDSVYNTVPETSMSDLQWVQYCVRLATGLEDEVPSTCSLPHPPCPYRFPSYRQRIMEYRQRVAVHADLLRHQERK